MGKLKKRPALELATPEMVRGMKVRSSVKKLCDGCKVRRTLGVISSYEEKAWREVQC